MEGMIDGFQAISERKQIKLTKLNKKIGLKLNNICKHFEKNACLNFKLAALMTF